jgi:phosphoglycolate phosphatase-like HAD superfamily hydrolase
MKLSIISGSHRSNSYSVFPPSQSTGAYSDCGAECVNEYQRQFLEVILPAAKQLLFPGVLDGLCHLKNHQFRLAVTTNKFSRSANALLTAAGIADFFDVVVCAVTHDCPIMSYDASRTTVRSRRDVPESV